MTLDGGLLADLERLERLFDLRLQLTIQPLEIRDLRTVGDLTLLPHFVIQGRIEHAGWREWLPGELAATQVSLLLIMHFEWGRFVCSVTRSGDNTRSIRLERLIQDRRIARTKLGRYISSLVLPLLNRDYSVEIAETGRVEVDREEMRLESYCDKFTERLSLVEKRSGAIDLWALFAPLLEEVKAPARVYVSSKSSLESIEKWVTLGYCLAAPDSHPYLSYQSEAGSLDQDLLPTSVPLVLHAIRGAWSDKEIVLLALLLRRWRVRAFDGIGFFQMTHEPGAPSITGRVVLLEEPSSVEAEALKVISVPVVKQDGTASGVEA